MHLHFDPVGGVAGDMFVAAMLDAFPHLRDGLLAALDRIGLPPGVTCAIVPHRDHALGGVRFDVSMAAADAGGHRHHHHHDHVRYAAIRERLAAAPLATAVRVRALAIFALLADAEARVHGVTPDDVTFHEVGAWDSIADIVAASYMIDGAGVRTCSIAPLPLGSGRIETAHGTLPVPAPATVLLLEGMRTVDDGLPGERVTPTGAAIVRHLGCAAGPGRQPRRLAGTGIGFGSRRLPGISNVLRVLVLADEPAAMMEGGGGRDEVAAIEFEVDDQTAEDLAAGLDRLRAMPDVLDVLQMPAFGKKGRLVSHVRVLARCDGEATVVAACFRETATIGLRVQTVRRAVLDRRSAIVEVDGRAVPVKIVARPDGVRTAKAESDALAADASAGRAGRERLRRAAEESALLRRDGTDEE